MDPLRRKVSAVGVIQQVDSNSIEAQIRALHIPFGYALDQCLDMLQCAHGPNLTRMIQLLRISTISFQTACKQNETKDLIKRGYLLLIVNILNWQLNHTLQFLVSLIENIPDCIRFWKLQQKRRIMAKLESGPIEWFLPRYRSIYIYIY